MEMMAVQQAAEGAGAEKAGLQAAPRVAPKGVSRAAIEVEVLVVAMEGGTVEDSMAKAQVVEWAVAMATVGTAEMQEAKAPRAGNDRRFATRSSGTLAVRMCSQGSKICTSPQEHSLNHP